MAVSIEDKRQKVISLRSEGMTYSEIMKELHLPKGTISRWLAGVTFDEKTQSRINSHKEEKQAHGLSKSKLSRQLKTKFRERSAYIEAKNFFEKQKRNPDFVAGIILYWAHGSQNNFYLQFTNADAEKIVIMRSWLQKYFKIERKNIKYRIFCHQNTAKISITHWQRILGVDLPIPVTFLKSKSLKNVENKGSLQILSYNTFLAQKMIFWQKLFIQYYKST